MEKNYFQLTNLRYITLLFIAIAATKLIIISGNETITEGSDSIEYLLIAQDWFWGYKTMPIRNPLFPLYVAIIHQFHLSLRMVSEIFFIVSAMIFAASLRKIDIPRYLIVVIFTILIFHPIGILVFDMPMSEGLFIILLMLNLVSAIFYLTACNKKEKIIFAILFGLTTVGLLQTRYQDATLVYFILAGIILLDILFIKKYSLKTTVISTLLIVSVVLIVNGIIFSLNYMAWGRFDYNRITTFSQKKLFHTLMEIDTGEKPIHPYIPISTQARLTAYKLSPTFAQFKNDIEGTFYKKVEAAGSLATFGRTGIKNQLDVSDTFGFINSVVQPKHIDKMEYKERIRTEDKLLNKICDEIEQGIKEGRAKGKFVFSILNPSLSVLIKSTQSSIKKILPALMHTESISPIKDNYPFYGSLFSPLYNEMTHRKLGLIKKGPLDIIIALPKTKKIKQVEFINNTMDFFVGQGVEKPFAQVFTEMSARNIEVYEKMAVATTITTLSKKDIPTNFDSSKDSSVYNFYQVMIPAVNDRVFLHFMKLLIKLKTGERIEISNLEERKVVEDKGYAYFIKSFNLQLTPLHKFGYVAQESLFKGYNNYLNYLVYFMLSLITIILPLNILYLITSRKCTKFNPMTTLIIGGLLLVVMSRVFFYAFIDANFFPINMDRHITPAVMLYLPVLFIIFYKVIHYFGCVVKNIKFAK